MKPLAIDLYCGLGGWTEGLLAEGYEVVGFDIEQHVYGEHRYPAQLVLQDVRTLHGRQFKDAALIVGSSPCQEFSYRAMPWKRARSLPPPALGIELFEAQFRIQREACEAAGRHVPLVAENVRGAIPWVGRSRWNYGSFHLWGDVPALMPMARAIKNNGGSWFKLAHNTTSGTGQNPDGRRIDHAGRALDGVKGGWLSQADGAPMRRDDGTKMPGQDWSRYGRTGEQSPHWRLAGDDGVKGVTPHGEPLGKNTLERAFGSKSPKRKAASAMIAKIPLPLARHIAASWRPA